jgi:hypothetical protein
MELKISRQLGDWSIDNTQGALLCAGLIEEYWPALEDCNTAVFEILWVTSNPEAKRVEWDRYPVCVVGGDRVHLCGNTWRWLRELLGPFPFYVALGASQ